MNSSDVRDLHVWSIEAEMANPACAKQMAELRKKIAKMEVKMDVLFGNGALNAWAGQGIHRQSELMRPASKYAKIYPLTDAP